jgi:hypothetical protein
MKQVGFSKEQIKFLDSFFQDKKKEMLKEVNKDSFEGDDKAFVNLCDELYCTKHFKNEKGKKKKTKKKSSPYMSWLWSDGMKEIKNGNPDAEQTVLMSLAGKKWKGMSEKERNKYKK